MIENRREIDKKDWVPNGSGCITGVEECPSSRKRLSYTEHLGEFWDFQGTFCKILDRIGEKMNSS